MDGRQARGRELAQGGRIKPVDGPLWFVPSDKAGGYLVNVETGQCGCPDRAEHREKCKHLWAVEMVRGALIPGSGAGALAPVAPTPAKPAALPPLKSALTKEEQAHIRAALRFLKARAGGWDALAKGIRSKSPTIKNVAYGRSPSAGLAVRLARFAGVPVDDVISGKYPPEGSCAHCGQCPTPRPSP